MIACPSCGHRAPEGSTSCPGCGAPLAASGHAEERRVVTTLFCDLVGFTALSERTDAELVDAFLRRYYAVARKAIEAYGGTVEKFIGDAVVAVFGVPTLHEDDPERAIRAGLRLIDEVDALPGIAGQTLEVRIGINTGEVLVALDVDPASGEGFLTGDAVNVAARLQSAAPPMAVAVGESTHTATEKVFAFEACHPVTLKGKGKPLAAWIATASLARTGSELRSFATEFVGREEELACLQALLDEAVDRGVPHFTLIVGEPGIGKSRLLAELACRLDDRPELTTWRQGRCLPFGANVTFWALSEIVRAQAGVLESDGVARTEARLETVLPDTADRDRLRARLRPLLGLEGEEAGREENFAAWREFLESLARDGPAVLVVEDLHWADEAMLGFMDYLARGEAAVPLLVLASARPEALELSGPGSGFVAAATRIALGPLSGEETAELARARLGAKSLPTDLQALILERSGGNPLCAEELVRLLQDRGLLEIRSGKVSLKPGAEVPLPDSIGALIAARLDLLGLERKALLADAAVVGRSFWAGAVAAVGPHDPAEVFEGLHELVAKELVHPERSSSIEGESEFAFVHSLVCDVAYNQLTRADRATKHARLARWLEQRTAGRTEDLAEVLAFHYGTALEMANAAGLFELEDELAEPTTRYLEMAGGRAAPLDAAAAAAHFARAERVADEAARPKRRFFLSRRARRTLKRRAPLLVTAAAVIVVALVAALAIVEFRPLHKPSGPVKLTAAQITSSYGPGIVQITANVPFGVHGRLTWKKVTGSGFVVDRSGTILTNATLMFRGYRGQSRAPIYPAYDMFWATVEVYGARGQYDRVRAFELGFDPRIGIACLAIEPSRLRLEPLPFGGSDSVASGQSVTALRRWHDVLIASSGTIAAVLSDAGEIVQLQAGGASSQSGCGGPLFDRMGHVIGLVGPVPYGLAPTTPANALGINLCMVGVSRIRKAYFGDKLWLGTISLWIDRKVAAALGEPRVGELVELDEPGGPAAQAGVRGGVRTRDIRQDHATCQYVVGGDIIVSLDGHRLTSGADYERLLNRHRPGDYVLVGAWRGGKFITVKVRSQRLPLTSSGS